MRFHNRAEAGRLLATQLSAYADRPDVIILALPRGGVPVGFEIAQALNLPLDVLVVRKLGVPGYEELAIGAIASNDVLVLNDDLIEELLISRDAIDSVIAHEQQVLEQREQLYRGNRPAPDVRGRTVMLVDDGLATGATMRVAIEAVRQQRPVSIIVVVPVASASGCVNIRSFADGVVCLAIPRDFHAVSQGYVDFSPTTDAEVRDLLHQAVQQYALHLTPF